MSVEPTELPKCCFRVGDRVEYPGVESGAWHKGIVAGRMPHEGEPYVVVTNLQSWGTCFIPESSLRAASFEFDWERPIEQSEVEPKCTFPTCEYLASSMFHSPCGEDCLLPKGHEPARSCHPYHPKQAKGRVEITGEMIERAIQHSDVLMTWDEASTLLEAALNG